MLCPECETRIKNLGKLVVDEGRRERVKTYIAEVVEASREIKEEEEGEVEEEDGVKKEEQGLEEQPIAPAIAAVEIEVKPVRCAASLAQKVCCHLQSDL